MHFYANIAFSGKLYLLAMTDESDAFLGANIDYSFRIDHKRLRSARADLMNDYRKSSRELKKIKKELEKAEMVLRVSNETKHSDLVSELRKKLKSVEKSHEALYGVKNCNKPTQEFVAKTSGISQRLSNGF